MIDSQQKRSQLCIPMALGRTNEVRDVLVDGIESISVSRLLGGEVGTNWFLFIDIIMEMKITVKLVNGTVATEL